MFQFSEVFEYGYASLGYDEYGSASSSSSFFNQVLPNQKAQVFFQDSAVDVRFVHYVCQFQWSAMRQHLENVYIYLELGTSHNPTLLHMCLPPVGTRGINRL
jgi:hypothetical protein